jgi:uncharacterized protein YndB with AHSA1/START domain
MTEPILQTEGPRPAVRFERHLSQPPPEVWRAITEPEGQRAWFPGVILTDEWKVGATLTFRDDNMKFTGTVLELDEPRLLVFTWGPDTLRFELRPEPAGGTLLVLVDELPPETAARNAAGWDVCLDRLAGNDQPDDWKPRFDRYTRAFEPVLGPQEGPPPGYEDTAS